jgi:hypothetical protein
VVIYLDSSVFLAWLFGEERRPSADFWSGRFVSSRLLAYETWTRANARAYPSHVKAGMEQALAVVDLIDMTPEVLARALQPVPDPGAHARRAALGDDGSSSALARPISVSPLTTTAWPKPPRPSDSR